MASEIRARADAIVPEAFSVIEALMAGAEKDSVRLAAAVRVLQIAGVPMGEPRIDGTVNPLGVPPETNSTPAELMEGLGPTEPLN
jgi:hypothetical protein